MRPLRLIPLSVLASALLIGTAAAQQFVPTTRIVNAIDESQLVTLKGNTIPAANAKNDRGQGSADLPMAGLTLVLSRSAEQQAAYDAFVASQYDQNSANFHQWLTPQQAGERFGPAQADVSTISGWLATHGFAVKSVGADRMTIQFSGTAGQVDSAFHTEIHNLSVNGKAHIANMTDPQIPAALAPVIVGVKGLHNFFPHPLHRIGSKVQFNPDAHGWVKQQMSSGTGFTAGALRAQAPAASANSASSPKPNFYIGNYNLGVEEDVAPSDFAKIYNLPSGWPTTANGSGQIITIIGTSDIVPGDIANFKTAFGLPAGTAPVIAHGPDGDPGVCSGNSNICNGGDLDENSLDVEWSGAVAPGAQVVLVTDAYNSQTSPTNDPIFDGAQWAIENASVASSAVNGTHIVSVSYGQCELSNGTASNVAYNNLWETAASAGIAVFVATGDSGAPSCDQGGDVQEGYPYEAQYGLSVSGLASSPYNTAVGGTDFSWCNPLYSSNGQTINGCSSSNASTYWNTSNASTTEASAKGYVPETPWNDTCLNPINAAYLEGIATIVGVSGISTPEEACNFVYQDSLALYFQYGDPMLAYYVDTVGGSGGASSCVVNSTTPSTLGSCSAGDTSTGSSYGNLPLVNDGWPKPSWQTGVTGIPTDGVRDLPDVSFFAGDGTLDSATLICVSNDGASCTNISETGSSSTGGAEEVGGTSVATPEMAGVMALINQKAGTAQGSPNAELYTLAGKQNYSNCSAETGTTTNGCNFNDIDNGTIAMPCASSGSVVEGGAIPEGGGVWGESMQTSAHASPNCSVVNSGDVVGTLSGYSAITGYDLASGLGSLNIANVIDNWTATTIGTNTAAVAVTPATSSITANQPLSVVVTVASVPAGGTTPTGTVTLSGGGYASTAESLSGGTYTFTIPGDSLSAGTDTLTVTYSGDSTYGTATGTANVAVSKVAATVTVTPSAASINSNQPLTVTGTVTGTGGTPTGTVMLSGGGYTSAATALSSGSYSITIPANSLTAGADTLVVAYSGDATYATANGSAVVAVTSVSVLPSTVTVTPASTTVDSNASLNVTAKVTGAGVTPTGTVTLTSGSYTSAADTLSSGSFTFTIPAGSLSAGSDTLTVNYSGDSNYTSAMGTASVTVDVSAFTLLASTAPAIATPGGTSTSTITVNATNGYTGTVTLTCALTGEANSGDIDLPTCSIPSAAVAAGGTATAMVSTTSATAELAYPKIDGRGRGWTGAGGGAVLALLLFFGIPARRRSWRTMVGMLVLMVTLGSLAGCGGGGGGTTTPTGTTPDTYTFTVTGAGTPAVTPAPTISFSVTVN